MEYGGRQFYNVQAVKLKYTKKNSTVIPIASIICSKNNNVQQNKTIECFWGKSILR